MSISIPIPIYKVNHLVVDRIKSIYVFYGNDAEITSIFEKVKRDITKREFKDPLTGYLIFNEEELTTIRNDPSINVIFTIQQIFSDDSIAAIKLKIVNEFSRTFSQEEIYMFCMKSEVLNAANIYKSLTQNNKIPLTNARLTQFLTNILRGEDDNRINKFVKNTYTYDDILALNISGKKYWVSKVLGQKFFIVENEYPFVCNPFEVIEYDSLIERASRKSLTTLNSHVLLSNGEFIGNNIYLCLAKDVLTNAERRGIDELTTIKLYYPFLFKKHNITSLSELNDKEQFLIDESQKTLSKQLLESFASVDVFYDMYKERKTDLKYKNNGITSIKITLVPEYSMKIPLDVIFKLIHATENNPLIKFNPATRRENIYRLYVDKISKDGRKIPFLSKALITKLVQSIGKGKSVSVYIQYPVGGKIINIICEFEENGNINVSSDFDNLMKISEIDDLFIKAVNPIIETISNYLQQSGYLLSLFKGVNDSSTIISYLNYQSIIEIDKVVKIKPFIGCISSAFIVESDNFKKGIEMRYKRVSNFNKTTSQEAYIIEKQKQKVSERDIIGGLVENYDMSQSEALQLFARLASELQVERGTRGSDIKIKINPGFKILMQVIHGTSNLKIDIENINDIFYLDTIPVFIDSLIRLTQDPNSTGVPLKTIKLLCSKGEKSEVVIEDIISSSEESMPEQEIPVIEGDDLNYFNVKEYTESFGNKEDRMRTAVDLLYDDSEYGSVSSHSKSDSSNSEGGATSSSVSENDIQGLDELSSIENENEKSLSSFGSLNSGEVNGLDLLASSASSSQKSQSSPELESENIQGLSELETNPSPDENNEEVIPSLKQLESPLQSPPKIEPIVESEPSLEIVENVPEEPETQISPEPALVLNKEQLPTPEKILIRPTKVKKIKILKEENENEEVRNIDGMKLANPTPFFKKMVERDPVLFLTEDSEKFNSYSRTCLSSNRVQPVILNEEEKRKVDEEMPGFLRDEDVLKYGSTPEKENYYICPRYWCLKTNMPISPEDVAAGKCGKVIPRNEKKVPKGAYVYEFFNPSQHGSEEKYIQHYPGFVNDTKSQKHPDNLCIPCCYKDASSIIQQTMKKKCIKPITEENVSEEKQEEEKSMPFNEELPEEKSEVVNEKKVPIRVVEKEEEYIQGPEKFPLEQGRWGYLPFQIQKFLHEINADCQISKTNTNIKPHHPCLLRHGVKYDDKQSFISCISDALLYDKSASNKDLKELIIRSLTIDSFITYQNGNLVQSFSNGMYSDINVEKYKSSRLFNKYKEEDINYFKQTINAFENFISFLRDDTVVIDYTYLWDIITRPNQYLFKSGINLVILEITDNDSTNNISLVCPTNHYSNEFYEARKKTLILMKKVGKKGVYFEPIYSYKDEETKIKIERLFSEYDPKLSKTMRAVFKKLIKPILQNKCLPLSSMPNQVEYKFKRPIEISFLIESLNKAKYQIIQQVVNYNNKVVGIIAKNSKGINGFVPCYPSSIDPTYDYVLINERGIYNTYKDTIDFLMQLYKDSRGKLNCKPDFKIIEDDVMIVGILTETNQFIELSVPEPLLNVNDSIKVFNSRNYLITDKETLLSTTKVDDSRVEYIKKIKLETNFLNVFRNTIRILLNEYENLSIREKIEELSSSIGDLYKFKLKNITLYLRELVGDKIVFSEDYNYEMVNEISTCIVNKSDKCESNKPLCGLINNGKTCQLVLPKRNLLNGSDNEIIYFAKMADEIIRYNRIRSFILKPQSYASFSPLNYNLKENEIIIIQSMLNKEYFEGLSPVEINKFIKYNTYDNVEPLKTQNYVQQISLDEAINPEESRECLVKQVENISSVFWRKTFPIGYGEFEYADSRVCTIYTIIDILKQIRGKEYSVTEIKPHLENEYKKYLPKYQDNIIDVLISEGKKTLGDQLKAGTLSFSNLIASESYFLTHFDLWLLLNAANIPSFFISVKENITYNSGKKIKSFLCYGNPGDKFVFIIVPAFAPEKIPTYKVINDKVNIAFSLDTLNEGEGLTDLNNSLENHISIEDYLNEFSRKILKPKPKKAAKIKLVLNEEEDVEIPIIKDAQAQADAQEQQNPIQLQEINKGPNPSRVIVHKKPHGNKKQETKKRKIKLKIVEE
uniref:Uncharacterized protein n=1 Tax=viral metagenome TaxID=1070528 RepID=A0A6C0KVK2_9ZZZZ